MPPQVLENLKGNETLNRKMASGNQMVLTTDDRLTLQSGQYSIVLNNNGKIDIKGAGPVTIKGSKRSLELTV